MFVVFFFASAAAVSPSNLEQFSAIVAPYTNCELEGEAKLKPDYDEWSEATRASYKNPADVKQKATSEKLFVELRTKSEAVRQNCGYERVHSQLREKILNLHPKMEKSKAFWFARSVFSSLHNLNEHIVRYEQGEFPKAPMPPTGYRPQ